MKIKELYNLLASIKTISAKRSQELNDWYDRFPNKDKTATLKNFFSALRAINIRVTEFSGAPLGDEPKLGQLVNAMKEALTADEHHQELKRFIARSEAVAQSKIQDSQTYIKSFLLWVADFCGESKTLTDALRNSAGITFQFALFNTLSVLYGAHLLTPENLHSLCKHSLFKYMVDVDSKIGKAEEIKQALMHANKDISQINRGLVQLYFDFACQFVDHIQNGTLFPSEMSFGILNIIIEELLLHAEIDARGVLHKLLDATTQATIFPSNEADLKKLHKQLDDTLDDKDKSKKLTTAADKFFSQYPLKNKAELVEYLSQYQAGDMQEYKFRR